MFIHAVYFWLKKGSPPSVREQLFHDCAEYLGRIPTVRHFWTGPPAMTPRPVVDNTYDAGLCVAFDDKAGHDLYQEHPLHKDFLARNQEHWQRVQVYDFM